MQIHTIKTASIRPGEMSLEQLLSQYVTELPANSVVAVTSKVVSLCEGAYVPLDAAHIEDLVQQHSSMYLAEKNSIYTFKFTITNNTLIPNAGIDKSNADGVYVLWPQDPQASANAIRAQLHKSFGRTDIGVIITDSTVRPLRRGVSGIAIAHSGFVALRNYVGQPDLFGRPFAVSQADLPGGLAAAAVFAMGEGAESTPLCILSGLDSIVFTGENPSAYELAEITITPDEDLFAPFLEKAVWHEGGIDTATQA